MAVLLVVLFLVVPILEIYVIIQVGQVIGAVPTVVLLIAESLLGAWLVKREGRRAWEALQSAIGSARLPSRELADGALVLVGGTLLLTPGFLTDIVGFFLILPFSRPLARRALAWVVTRRATVVVRRFGGGPPDGRFGPPGPPRSGDGRVVPGEVVDDDRPPT